MDDTLKLLKAAAQDFFTQERREIGTLLNRAKTEDLPVITRTLRRLATIEVQARLLPAAAIPLEQERTMLLNTLSAMAVSYGLDSSTELNRTIDRVLGFAEALLGALLDKALAAAIVA